MKTVILPSVMAQNQQEMNELLGKFKSVSTQIHLDVADGKFVPTKVLQFNLQLLKGFTYSAHLMMEKPMPFIKEYWDKIDLFIPQIEVFSNPQVYIDFMREQGKKVAFALKPETSVERVKKYIAQVDHVLILTVHPGYYGAKFLPGKLRKITQVKKINRRVKVIVDGHMNPQTIPLARGAGADMFVAGSYLMKGKSITENMKILKKCLK
jgi:ribulose-phosphate 3-epimerase